ncbi:MAG: hypothetical protein LBJ23_04960, partial [Tannerella sp.]|nr:hypothetical protein [Tannerella sp.]
VKTSTVDKEYGYDDAKGEETVVETRRPVEHETRARTIEYFSDGDAPDAPAEVDGFKKWPPKKFPCDIPFKALEKNGRKLAWNIESITCTGPAEDKRGYRFTVRGTGVTDSRKYTPGSRTLTFVPEEKGSTSIDMSLAAAYSFPGVDAGDPFAFEFKGLFPGYYHEDLFAGFLIFDD